MKLTEQERGQGILVVTCKCCGNVYKAHELSNACSYSLTPNFGCRECQGVVPSQDLAEAQRDGLKRFNQH